MTKTRVQQAPRPETRVSRFLRGHWRLVVSILFGILVIFFLPQHYRWVSRGLIGWDAGVILYLVLVLWLVAHADGQEVRRKSALHDEGRIAIPILTVAAGVA